MVSNWRTVFGLLLPLHAFGLLALVSFDAVVAWTFGVGYVLISGLGIAVGYHRCFSHRSVKPTSLQTTLMLYFGTLGCQGSALLWAAIHRLQHHKYADVADKDAHSPVDGWWHAYAGWIVNLKPEAVSMRVPDLLRDPQVVWFNRHYFKLIYLTWLIAALWSWELFLGLALAQCWAFHQEMIVDLFCHSRWFGYRTYDTPDNSVNSLIGYVTWGQGWHNNHHHDPSRANFARKRWEFDPTVIFTSRMTK